MERIIRLYRIYGFKKFCWFSLLAVYRFLFLRLLKGSYSQDGADILIDKLLGEKKTGFYVDIGANDPIKYSNTCRFYKKGWRGVNIDPNPEFLTKFRDKRKEDINLNFGVSDKKGKLVFFSFSPDVNSTFDKVWAEKCLKEGCKLVAKKDIPVYPLSSILAKYAPNNKIDFLSIDTEGWDLNVLKGNNWQKVRPKIICVETTEKDEKKIRKLLSNIGYREEYRTSNSIIFADQKRGTKSLTIIAAHLQTPEIVSGGDKIFYELAKIWSTKLELRIIIPLISYPGLIKTIKAKFSILSQVPFIETGKGKKVSSLFFLTIQFLYRVVLVYKLLGINDQVIYSPGDFITNILPAVLLKIKYKDTFLAADVHHLNENPFKRRGNLFLANFVSFAFQRLSLFFLKKYADVIFLLNTEMKQRLIRMGFSGEKLFIVGSGLDYSAIEKYPADPALHYEAIFFGRICPTKGMLDLPIIWQMVTGVFPKAKLGLIGYYSSPWKEIFEKEVSKYQLKESVQVLGFLPDKKAYGILKSAKIFISPSYEEGWGMSMCEAKVCRLPVIAYDLPVYKEIFKGGVRVVPKGNTKIFAENIVDLLKNKDARKKLAEQGINIMKDYDWQKLAEKKLGIINQIVLSGENAK